MSNDNRYKRRHETKSYKIIKEKREAKKRIRGKITQYKAEINKLLLEIAAADKAFKTLFPTGKSTPEKHLEFTRLAGIKRRATARLNIVRDNLNHLENWSGL